MAAQDERSAPRCADQRQVMAAIKGAQTSVAAPGRRIGEGTKGGGGGGDKGGRGGGRLGGKEGRDRDTRRVGAGPRTGICRWPPRRSGSPPRPASGCAPVRRTSCGCARACRCPRRPAPVPRGL